MLWGGSRWWKAEAASYRYFVLFRPFDARAVLRDEGGRRILTLSIHDPRWTGRPAPTTRYNALMPDHGKLMHMFLVREPGLDAFAHLHPVPRTPAGLAFDAGVPPLPPGRYRVYGDIVHESGYVQTLVASVDMPDGGQYAAHHADPDDSWFVGDAAPEAARSRVALDDGPTVVWERGGASMVENEEQTLTFFAQDAAGAPLALEPYMGMLAHVAVAHEDGSVFAHLHPAGSISMAALQKFGGQQTHTDHVMPAPGDLSIPYAFPKAGRYHIWVQMKHAGRVITAAFDANVRART
jgi:hypothetical protein